MSVVLIVGGILIVGGFSLCLKEAVKDIYKYKRKNYDDYGTMRFYRSINATDIANISHNNQEHSVSISVNN